MKIDPREVVAALAPALLLAAWAGGGAAAFIGTLEPPERQALLAMLEKYGEEQVDACIDMLLDMAERQMRSLIAGGAVVPDVEDAIGRPCRRVGDDPARQTRPLAEPRLRPRQRGGGQIEHGDIAPARREQRVDQP